MEDCKKRGPSRKLTRRRRRRQRPSTIIISLIRSERRKRRDRLKYQLPAAPHTGRHLYTVRRRNSLPIRRGCLNRRSSLKKLRHFAFLNIFEMATEFGRRREEVWLSEALALTGTKTGRRGAGRWKCWSRWLFLWGERLN